MKYPGLKISIIESGKRAYEVADQLGWHTSKISNIIAGAYRPTPEEKRALSDVLGKPTQVLFAKWTHSMEVV